MINIDTTLWVGSAMDCLSELLEDWAIVHVCQAQRCHALTRERTGPQLISTLQDTRAVINTSLSKAKVIMCFCHKALDEGRSLLIHCQAGRSRGPALALLLLQQRGVYQLCSLATAIARFRETYPDFLPSLGMSQLLLTCFEYVTLSEDMGMVIV